MNNKEKIAGGVVVENVSRTLPINTKKYSSHDELPKRSLNNINRLFIHCSGAHGAPGFKGCFNSARYVVKNRDFPCAAYHYFINYKENRDENGNLIIYQMNELNTRSWHTGGAANTRGIGICCQGALLNVPHSFFQEECLEALIPYLQQKFNLNEFDWLSFHSEAERFGGRKKLYCPGRSLVKWVVDYRSKL